MNSCASVVLWVLGLLVVVGGFFLFLALLDEVIEYLKSRREARLKDELHQARLLDQIVRINEDSLGALESMPMHLESAERHLDRAQLDFSEGAFSPFWDSIEKAARALAGFDERVTVISTNSSQYIDLRREYRGPAPPFSVSRVSTPKLKVASETAKRMTVMVRHAQRNFQFSIIYEQRKTNQILIAGFTNLAHALEQMTWQITSSIDNLASSVDRMSSTINQSLERIAVDVAAHRDDFANESAARGAREQKALEMLDNIQRRRYPSIVHGGLR